MSPSHDHAPDDLDTLDLDHTEQSGELRQALAGRRRKKGKKATDAGEVQGVEALLHRWSITVKNLSPEEELGLLREATNPASDETVRERAVSRLVQANARRVFQVVNRLRADRDSVDMDELLSAGLNGLNKAIMRWDEARASSAKDMGVARFASGASQWIYKMAMEEFRGQVAPDLTEREFFLLNRLTKTRAEFERTRGAGQYATADLVEALRAWALMLCRKNRIMQEQKRLLGRVRPHEVEAALAAWTGPDDFTEKELRSRGAIDADEVSRLLELDRSRRIFRLDQALGEDGRTLGDTLADEGQDAGDTLLSSDDAAVLAGLSSALGDRLDDLSYRHGFRMGQGRGLGGRHVYGEHGVVPALGLEDGELGMALGERGERLVARRGRQAQRLGGLEARPDLLIDLAVTYSSTGAPRPDLLALFAALGQPTAPGDDGLVRAPCPVTDRPDLPVTASATEFRCGCGCGSQGDAFDWWVAAQGLPADQAAAERRRFAWQWPRRGVVPKGSTVVSDPAREVTTREALRPARRR